MAELWDVYDINRNKIGKKIERENYKFKEGEYFLITVAVIMNSKKQVLITRRSETKKTSPLKWDLTGGGTRAGETTLQAICRETSEEIGMKFKPEDATFLKEIRRDGVPSSFKDFWLFRSDINADEIQFPDGEAVEAKWATIDEILQMLKNMTLEDKKRLKGLQPKRADIITAGVVILDIIMEKLELNEIIVSEYDNLEGLMCQIAKKMS